VVLGLTGAQSPAAASGAVGARTSANRVGNGPAPRPTTPRNAGDSRQVTAAASAPSVGGHQPLRAPDKIGDWKQRQAMQQKTAPRPRHRFAATRIGMAVLEYSGLSTAPDATAVYVTAQHGGTPRPHGRSVPVRLRSRPLRASWR